MTGHVTFRDYHVTFHERLGSSGIDFHLCGDRLEHMVVVIVTLLERERERGRGRGREREREREREEC